MNKLIDIAVDHARTVLLILCLLIISGVVTYIEIPQEADPAVEFPLLYVDASIDGISPKDADRILVAPLQNALESVEGLRDMYSEAYEGGASVTLEFAAGFNSNVARNDVREAVDRAMSSLPDNTRTPQIEEVNTSTFPQIVVGLGGEVPERALYLLADELKQALESLPGVLDVTLNGKREEMVEIIVDPAVLESYNISPVDLAGAVNRNNEQVAAGVLDSGIGRFSLKVPGIIESSNELLNLPVKSVDNNVVRMGDIAQVRRVFKDAMNIARVDGQPAITMEVKKRSGANVVDTINSVKEQIALLQQTWPSSLEVNYFGDRSLEIREIVGDLENSVLIAVLLVVVVVLGYMGLRSAVLVAVAIPGSFVIGILVIGLMGLTVNTVVLFALIMSVGILVDGAIVVTEFADRRMIAGQQNTDAYKASAKRMAWPIMASTATTLAAFLPLMFWPGDTGEFMKFLPITVVATLTASLVMALLFIPTMGGIIGKPKLVSAQTVARIETVETGDLNSLKGISGKYVSLLSWAVRRPGTVLLTIIAILVSIIAAYSKLGQGTEFFPDVEPDQAVITLLARGDLSVKERDKILRQLEDELLGISEIRTIYSRTSILDNEAIGFITLEFTDWDDRDRRADDVLRQVRSLEQSIAGLRFEIQKMNAGPGGDTKAIQLAFTSDSNQDALDTTTRVRQWMLEHGGFADIEDSLPQPGIEWNVNVDRQEAGRYGADISLVGTFVQMVTNGVKLSSYRPDDSSEELDIRVRFPAELRKLSQLQNLRISTVNGYVPLSNFATFEPGPKLIAINRLNGMAVHRLLAAPKALPGEEFVNLGQLATDRMNELSDYLDTIKLTPGVSRVSEGQDEDRAEAEGFIFQAMGVALFIMAIILVTQFNSFYQTLLILTAVVLSSGGVLLGLLITGDAFSVVMSGVGVIALAGIVVNNNIVLVDTYNQLIKDDMPVIDAAVRTGVLRLRPVMLTTITTVLGLTPMALQISIDLFSRDITIGSPSTQWWSQLAITIAGGLTFATILTLILTPCLLAYPTILAARKNAKALKNKLESQAGAPRYKKRRRAFW